MNGYKKYMKKELQKWFFLRRWEDENNDISIWVSEDSEKDSIDL